MDLSIIIPNYNTKEVLEKSLTKIRDSRDKFKKQVIVVDDASKDGSSEMIKKKFPWVVLIKNNKNMGFAKSNNIGYRGAKGRYILMLNSDAFIGKNTIQKTLNFMENNPEIGVVGCRLKGEDGKIKVSIRYFRTPWRIFYFKMGWARKFHLLSIEGFGKDFSKIQECDWVPGCFLLTRKKIIDKIGFLDNNFYLYYDDVDYCFRVKKAGWKVFYYPEDVIHLGGYTTKKIDPNKKHNEIDRYLMESEYLYFRKNYGLVYVFLNTFFLLLYDILCLNKIVKGENIKNELSHINLTLNLLIKSRFGKKKVY